MQRKYSQQNKDYSHAPRRTFELKRFKRRACSTQPACKICNNMTSPKVIHRAGHTQLDPFYPSWRTHIYSLAHAQSGVKKKPEERRAQTWGSLPHPSLPNFLRQTHCIELKFSRWQMAWNVHLSGAIEIFAASGTR